MLDNVKIYHLTQYITENKANKDVFALFNEWTTKNRVQIRNFEEAMWVLNHIRTLQHMDITIIKEAQILDQKQIEKERIGAFNG
jgi:hypothetical protein